jgi:hypothetical protein
MNHQPDDGSNKSVLISTRLDGEISRKTAIFRSNNMLHCTDHGQFLEQMNDYQLLVKDCVAKRMTVKMVRVRLIYTDCSQIYVCVCMYVYIYIYIYIWPLDI